MIGAPGQPEAVHGYRGDGIIGHLEFYAGVDGPTLIFGHGKNGAGNQILQLALRQHHRTAAVYVRQLRVILGGFGGNGERGIACPNGNLVILAYHHGHRAFRQSADDVAEELGREDALAGIGHIRFDIIGNGGFHIVAGKAQPYLGTAQNTLDDGKTALLSDGSSGDIQSRNQHTFFTGKTHGQHPFLLSIQRYLYSFIG